MAPRDHRARATQRAAAVSVVSNSALIAGKLVIGVVSGSVSIISEALHSGVDLGASVIAWLAVRKAAQPADERHQYGHGKYESLSALAEAVLIVFAAGFIIAVAIHKLIEGHHLEHSGLGVAVMAISAVANMVVSIYLFRVARAHESIAIEADAWHLRTDVYTSAGVAGGLLIVALTGHAVLDPILAIIVALLISREGYRISRDAASQLVDRALPQAEVDAIVQLIEEHAGQYLNFHNVRSRRAGGERHIDLHLVVRKDVSVAEAHAVADHLEKEIARRFPGTRALIHVEPGSEEAGRRGPQLGEGDGGADAHLPAGRQGEQR
jgi:cation diffusion facilitator family transporter